MENLILQSVDEVYTSVDIHKSIFICDTKLIDYLHKMLLQKDYPICTTQNLMNFNTMDCRVLLLDDNYISTFEKTLSSLVNLNDVNTVLYLNTDVRLNIPELNNVKEFFL